MAKLAMAAADIKAVIYLELIKKNGFVFVFVFCICYQPYGEAGHGFDLSGINQHAQTSQTALDPRNFDWCAMDH